LKKQKAIHSKRNLLNRTGKECMILKKTSTGSCKKEPAMLNQKKRIFQGNDSKIG
jgi:hypothetical protein